MVLKKNDIFTEKSPSEQEVSVEQGTESVPVVIEEVSGVLSGRT